MIRRVIMVFLVTLVTGLMFVQVKGVKAMEFNGCSAESPEIDFDFRNADRYSFDIMKEYFCERLDLKSSMYIMGMDDVVPNFTEISEKFPVKYLRENDGYRYSIFEIEGGGRFYVFWNMVDDYVYPCAVCYIENRNASDFCSIIPGISNISDVMEIDRLPIRNTILSSGPYFYVILEYGKVLKFQCDGNSGVIKGKDLVSKTDSIADYVLSKDYP